MIRGEADRLIRALDAELNVPAASRSTHATSEQLSLARRLVDWIATEATEGRRPDKAPTWGMLSNIAGDAFDPFAPLTSELIAFETAVRKAIRSGNPCDIR